MLEAPQMSPDPVNPTYAYVGAFVDELQRSGVRNVVICPGSRSTPLAMAFAAQVAIRVWMHVDERSAAYFGLGMAKQLRQPVALLCTSGTAAANFLPALVEASLTRIPLLVLTADRPHELRDNGAPQSIDQNRLFGTYAKWFVEVALPEATDAALRYIRTLAARASALTQASPAGPVHLNFPFREPLAPEPIAAQSWSQVAQRDLLAWQGRPHNRPYVEVRDTPAGAPSETTIARLAHMVRGARRGLIVVGPLDAPSLAEPLLRLAQRLGYPVLADPLSQLRCGDHDQRLILSNYDAFLRHAAFVEHAQPELVLRFGAMPTSKPLLLYLQRYAHCPLVVVDGQHGWEEPTQFASDLIHADPFALCQNLLTALDAGAGLPSPPPIDRPASGSIEYEWATAWQDADRVTRDAINAAMQDFDELFEGRVFTELAHLLPGGVMLYVGNSMPVRDLDTFFSCTREHVRIMGNRGANGIDGVVSSALGASAGAGREKPVVLVLGDLSFFHDLNGLLAARLHGLRLTIVLINNDGGGIFSFLPQAAYQEHFEQLFGTPTGLDFSHAVQMYGGRYEKAQGWEQFRKLVSEGLSGDGLQVIEVSTDRVSNVKMHRHLWKVVGEALDNETGPSVH